MKKALVRCGQSPDFAVWSKVAADRGEWRKLRGQMTPLPRPKPTAYAEQVHDIFYGPPPPDAPPPIAPIALLPAAPLPAPLPPPLPAPLPAPPLPAPAPAPASAPALRHNAPRAARAARPNDQDALPYDLFFATTTAVVGGHGGMVVVAIDSGASPHLGHMLRLE